VSAHFTRKKYCAAWLCNFMRKESRGTNKKAEKRQEESGPFMWIGTGRLPLVRFYLCSMKRCVTKDISVISLI